MKVILGTDITGVGEEGAVVDVSSGYARNYLFPAKKAVQHNEQNCSVLKSRQKAIEQRREARRKEHASVKERLESEAFVIAMKTGDTGHLYGAVTAQIVEEMFVKQGITVSKSHIVFPYGRSIKEIGEYNVSVKLYHDVQAQCTIRVTDLDGNITPKKAEKSVAGVETETRHESGAELQSSEPHEPVEEHATDEALSEAVAHTFDDANSGPEEKTASVATDDST